METNLKKLESWLNTHKDEILTKDIRMYRIDKSKQVWAIVQWQKSKRGIDYYSLKDILLDHSVAKVRFGEEYSGQEKGDCTIVVSSQRVYEFYLTRLVLQPTDEAMLSLWCEGLEE